MSFDLPNKKYDVIYADPPWKYNQGMKHLKPENHYETMTNDEILNLPVKQISKPDCLLFMWSTSAFMEFSIEVGNRWGFKYKTIAFVWRKLGNGVPGPWTFQNYEYVLLFTKGCRPKPKGSTKEHQEIEEFKTRHSEKPLEVLKRIERIAGSDKGMIELFARKQTPGWDSWGNEIVQT